MSQDEPDAGEVRPVWRRVCAGPLVLVAGAVVAVPAGLSDALGVPGPAGLPRTFLLCLDPLSGTGWTRAGDPSVGIELAAGAPVEAVEWSRLSHVAASWPQSWGACAGLVPERLLPGLLLANNF